MSGRLILAALALVAAGAAMTAPTPPPTKGEGTGVQQQPIELTYRDVVMAATGCGTERWSVKTASDADRNLVSTSQHQTTIDALRGLRPPSSLPPNNRIRPTELTEYVIAGTLTGYKLEGDGDIHLLITNSAGRTVIAELADPRCVTAAKFKAEVTNVRRVFLAHYSPTSTMQNPHRAIRVRGIGFFDYRHGQTGVAPNGVELHPVLGLGFP